MGEISHLSTGYSHTAFVTNRRKVFVNGFNLYGQCGVSNNLHEIVSFLETV